MAKNTKAAQVEMQDDEDQESFISFSEDLSDAEAPLPLPERDYPATITDAARHSTQDGRPMIKTTWKVSEDDYPVDYDASNAPGGKTITMFLMADDTPPSRFRVRRFLEAVGAPLSKGVNPKTLIGLTGRITIKHEEYEGQPREKISRVDRG